MHLSVEEYIEKFHDCEEYLRSFVKRKKSLASGMLLFATGAERWYGPFKGGYVFYMLEDFSSDPTLPSIASLNQMEDVFNQKHYPKKKREEYTWYKESATYEYPFRLYLCGNDDTSYSRFFPSVSEAQTCLNALLGKEQLDFSADIIRNQFVFTN